MVFIQPLFFSFLYRLHILFFFFFNDTATTEIYTLSLHDALPISRRHNDRGGKRRNKILTDVYVNVSQNRSEEHTSELQSRPHLVCRLLLEKKKKAVKTNPNTYNTDPLPSAIARPRCPAARAHAAR